MAAVELDEGRIEQVAEYMRERIRIEHSLDKDLDPRDIERVQNEPRYAYRFAKQRLAAGGDENDALKMLLNALQFRSSYGVNDLTFQDINKEQLHMGICYPRGQDREGSDIVYLLIRMHRKEKEKGEQLKRFALYFLEKHDRHFPNRRMSLFMDCSESGYSNMDMDLVKFIISLFKQFYPLKLGSIYVFEMPWVMNAGWSIIKNWLSPAARNKMRFTQKDSIGQFFERSQLIARYGGTDTWRYQYPPQGGLEAEGLERILPLLQDERANEEEIRKLVTEMVYRYEHGGEMPSPEKEKEVLKEPEVRELSAVKEEIEEEPLNSRKVRFASERDTSGTSPTLPPPPPLPPIRAGSRGIMKHNVPPDNASAQHIGNLLEVSPQSELVFQSADPSCTLRITNLSPGLISFKIKTTSPNKFKVLPSLGVIDCRGNFNISIACMAEDLSQIRDEKFLIQSISLQPDSKTGQTELTNHWRSIPSDVILENRLKCRVVDSTREDTPKPPLLPLIKQRDTNDTNDTQGLVRSITGLLMEVEHMHGILKKIYTIVIALAFGNFILMVVLLRG